MADPNSDDELLALQLNLEELNEFANGLDPKGKRRVGDASDIEVALQDYRMQIEQAVIQINDAKLARSLSRAVQSDTNILRQHVQEESRAVADRLEARRLNGDDVGAMEIDNEHQDDDVDSGAMEVDDQHQDVGHVQSTGHAQASAQDRAASVSSPAASVDVIEFASSVPTSIATFMSSIKATFISSIPFVNPVSTLPPRVCVCCNDQEQASSMLIQVPCGDTYCTDCLRNLFIHATKDESLFPPRCCQQHIHIDTVATLLSADELTLFEKASVEFSTQQRTYCATASCGAFIPPTNIRADIAKCQECNNLTCTVCKQAGHEGDCPQDTSVQTTLELAADNNWRRCNNCQRMIELNLGCNHITYVQA